LKKGAYFFKKKFGGTSFINSYHYLVDFISAL
jgi:hypothetical protein